MLEVGAGPATDGGFGRADRTRHRALSRRTITVVAIVVALLAGAVRGAVWWERSGTFLDASGAGYGGPAEVNQLYSVGIELETHGGRSVRLDRVTAAPLPGAQVTWSIYRGAPGAMGFGSNRGPLGPQWPTTPVHGARVAQPSDQPDSGATWLIASVRASRPGVYQLRDITIEYHSGPRTRHTASHTTLCVLVHTAADGARILREMNTYEPYGTDLTTLDPLVADYERCLDPTQS